MSPTGSFPRVRLRRLRRTPALRDMVRESSLALEDLIWPIFVEEGIDEPLPVQSMPGVVRYPEASAGRVVREAWAAGIKSVMLFGVSHHKDASGSDSYSENGLLSRMVARVRDAAPDIVLFSDTCFCEYTDHGHCGVLRDGDVDNDLTLENLVAQSLVAARAGADMIAPSGMMDGQVAAIRMALDEAGFENTGILAYSSKFASSFYGPFREAAGTELKGDRRAYQADPANGREAIRESLLDEAEGADMLMVKPGMPYLDVLCQIRQHSLLPLAAYQVSGEYSMIKFAAQAGALDEASVVAESLIAFKRAGADMVLSYFAMDLARNWPG